MSSITRNFIICNYQCTWPLDHDDGSNHYNDTYNALLFGGAKNYLGHSKTSTHNLYVYPNAQPRERGLWNTTTWAGYQGIHYPICASSEGNIAAGADRSGYNETWAHNRCLLAATSDIATFHAHAKTRIARRKNTTITLQVPAKPASAGKYGNTSHVTGSSVYYYDSCDPTTRSSLAATTDNTYNNTFYAPNKSVVVHCGATGEGPVWTLEQYQGRGQDIGSVAEEPPTTDEVLGWIKQLVFDLN